MHLSVYLTNLGLSVAVAVLVVGAHVMRKIAKKTRQAHATYFKIDPLIIAAVLGRDNWCLYSGVGVIVAASIFVGLLVFP